MEQIVEKIPMDAVEFVNVMEITFVKMVSAYHRVNLLAMVLSVDKIPMGVVVIANVTEMTFAKMVNVHLVFPLVQVIQTLVGWIMDAEVLVNAKIQMPVV
jgi:hypothetical protein